MAQAASIAAQAKALKSNGKTAFMWTVFSLGCDTVAFIADAVG
jgi:hypothetical protein